MACEPNDDMCALEEHMPALLGCEDVDDDWVPFSEYPPAMQEIFGALIPDIVASLRAQILGDRTKQSSP